MTKTAISVAAALLLCACATTAPTTRSALAELAPTKGNTAKGTVTFTQQGDRVLVVANISGLPPGNHGFHIHEKGDCTADDATSAGGHFNPLAKPHGDPAHADHHAGDMPMLVADASGVARLNATIDTASIGAGPTGIVGKAVIVHKDPDDFKTQPTGNSGARIACGVVRAR